MPDLADRVTVLTGQTRLLREDVAGFRAQLAQTRGHVWWIALVAVIALGLAGAVAVVGLRGAATDRRLDALCPVLALTVGSYNPDSRPEGPARDAYIAAMDVMRHAYQDTACADVAPLVPPRTPGS